MFAWIVSENQNTITSLKKTNSSLDFSNSQLKGIIEEYKEDPNSSKKYYEEQIKSINPTYSALIEAVSKTTIADEYGRLPSNVIAVKVGETVFVEYPYEYYKKITAQTDEKYYSVNWIDSDDLKTRKFSITGLKVGISEMKIVTHEKNKSDGLSVVVWVYGD